MKKYGKIVLTCLTIGAAIGIVKKIKQIKDEKDEEKTFEDEYESWMREQENSNKKSDFEDDEDLDECECMKEVKKECEYKPDEKVGD